MSESNYNNLKRICKDRILWDKIYLFGYWNTEGKYDKIIDDLYLMVSMDLNIILTK